MKQKKKELYKKNRKDIFIEEECVNICNLWTSTSINISNLKMSTCAMVVITSTHFALFYNLIFVDLYFKW